MKVLLLIPALAYLALIMINLQIFQQNTEINFFWLASFDIPVVIFVSIFFILYIILIWFGFNISNFFTGYKNKKLEKEVIDLKGKLLNKQWELVKNIENHFEAVLTKFKGEADKKLELYKKENEKIVSNMKYDFDAISKKIDKIK